MRQLNGERLTNDVVHPLAVDLPEVPDARDLRMWLKVNGTFRQYSSTREMIFDVSSLVSYCLSVHDTSPGISSVPARLPEWVWA